MKASLKVLFIIISLSNKELRTLKYLKKKKKLLTMLVIVQVDL